MLFGFSALGEEKASAPYPLPPGSMIFHIEDNSIRVRGPFFRYDIRRTSNVRIGEVVFDPNQVRVELNRVGLVLPVSKEYRYLNLFGLSWPKDLVTAGHVVVKRFDGQMIWEGEYNYATVEAFRAQVAQLEKGIPLDPQYQRVSRPGNQRLLKDALFGFFGSGEMVTQMRKPFRFCITQRGQEGGAEICSPWLIYHNGVIQQNFMVRSLENEDGTVFETRDPGRITTLKVIVDGQELGREDELNLAQEKVTKVSVESQQGFYVRYWGRSPKMELQEVVREGDQLHLQGFDDAPYGAIQYKKIPVFLRKTLWLDTINPQRAEWWLKLPYGAHSFPASTFTAITSYMVDYNRVPNRAHRPIMVGRKPMGTYARRLDSWVGMTDDKAVLKQTDGRPLEKQENGTFHWPIDNIKKHEYNPVELKVVSEDGEDSARYRVYRAPSTDVSLRMEGLLTDTLKSGVLVEGYLGHWFEDIFKMGSPALTYQHWGMGIRWSQTVVGIPTKFEDGSSQMTQMKFINFDIKYRIVPGVWGLQEGFGPMVSVQEMGIDEFKDMILGGGWFWSKSFPRVFSQMVDWIPIFNYPKWVDMEFIYYAEALRHDIKLMPTFNLNFHGKINWSPTFFGDLGFGIKRYQMRDLAETEESAIAYFYGVVGGGISF